MGGFGNVVRLPFGKVLKLNTNRNEISAMEYVRSHTSVLSREYSQCMSCRMVRYIFLWNLCLAMALFIQI